jgi:hypothetical protein
MSINVEMIGETQMIQHYIGEITEPHRSRMVSLSDAFTPNGRPEVHVLWELSVVDSHAHLGPQPRNDHFVAVTGRRRQGAALTGPTPRPLRSTPDTAPFQVNARTSRQPP